jgi:hypothetical protein
MDELEEVKGCLGWGCAFVAAWTLVIGSGFLYGIYLLLGWVGIRN